MRLLLFLFPFLFAQVTTAPTRGSIQLTLKNIESTQGSIRVAIYDNEQDFEQQSRALYGEVISDFSTKEKKIQLPLLSYGDYAIAVYHDLNNNNRLDKTLLGIPREPYAFSNNPTAKWSPPTFTQSKFQLREEQLEMSIQLRLWRAY